MKKNSVSLLFLALCGLSLASLAHAEVDAYGDEIREPWENCYRGARKPAILENFTNQAILTDSGVKPSMKQVEETVVKLAQSMKWGARVVGDGKIELTDVVRTKHRVVVLMSFDQTRYSLEYQSSENLNAALCEGTWYIHPNYNRWVATLNAAIKRELATIQ